MKVRVDQEKCIGCGLCTSLAEAVFAFNDEGKVSAGEVTADDEEAVEMVWLPENGKSITALYQAVQLKQSLKNN